MPKIPHKELAEELHEDSLIDEFSEFGDEDMFWSKEEDDIALQIYGKNLPEDVTLKN